MTSFIVRALITIPLAAAKSSWVDWLRTGSHGISEIVTAGVDEIQSAFGVVTPVASSRDAPAVDKWAALTKLLQGWEFTKNYSISVGDSKHGRLFVYEGGNFRMDTSIPTGSTSKWPSAMLFAGLVNDGTLKSLSDPVNKYLSWWTKDPKDPRSLVTFEMLLSFTSGFGDGHPGQESNNRAAREWRAANGVPRGSLVLSGDACNETSGDALECAKSIYANVKLIGTPGRVYSYNSNHLQLAAGVAVTVTKLSIQEVIKKYLLEPYDMRDSYYAGKCPDFGGDLITTGNDYEKFLHGVLSYKVLSRDITEASEKDHTPFMSDFYTLYGNYGFGHFLWCFDSAVGMTEKCREDRVHVDPGAFGFIPMIDRKNEYYVQVVAAEIEPTGSYPLSGIPEYLAVSIKPVVDAIMGHTPFNPQAPLTHGPDFLSLSVADVNYCLNCVLHPETCS